MVAFRPQAFSTSRRLTPCQTLRAYFIPLAPAGFPLQGLYSRGAVSPFGDLFPLAVALIPPPVARRPNQSSSSGLCSPRGLHRYPSHGLSETGRGTLLGSCLSRVSLPSAVGRLSTPLPSRAWTRAVRDVAASAPQGISGPSEWLISRETASPRKILDLFELLTHSRAPPDLAHVFASGPTSRCHDAKAFFDPCRLPTGAG